MAHQSAAGFDELRVLAGTLHQFERGQHLEEQLARGRIILLLNGQPVELDMGSRQDINDPANPANGADHQALERKRITAAEDPQTSAAPP